jgi:hypothetical protein
VKLYLLMRNGTARYCTDFLIVENDLRQRLLHIGDEERSSEVTCRQARHLNRKQLAVYNKETVKWWIDNLLPCRKWKLRDFAFMSWKWRLWSNWQRGGSALKRDRKKERYRLCCYYVNTPSCLRQYFSFRNNVVARNISNLFFISLLVSAVT